MVPETMTVERIKAWVDIVSSGFTTLALLVGGVFGMYQYLEKTHDDRVKETLNFLDRYNREPVAQARAQLQAGWSTHQKQEKTIKGKDLDAFLEQVIKDENLAAHIAVLNDFYASLEVCVRNDICDPAVALQLFQEKACSFFNRHRGYILGQRKDTRDTTIGDGTERFAQDARGTDTVSCIVRVPPWYRRLLDHIVGGA